MIFAHELSYHNFPLLIFPLKHLFCGACRTRCADCARDALGALGSLRTLHALNALHALRTRNARCARCARRAAGNGKGKDGVHASRRSDGSRRPGLARDRLSHRDGRRALRTCGTRGSGRAADHNGDPAVASGIVAAGAGTIPAIAAASVHIHSFPPFLPIARGVGRKHTALFHHILKGEKR